jgi:hypothetical protein
VTDEQTQAWLMMLYGSRKRDFFGRILRPFDTVKKACALPAGIVRTHQI